MNYSGYLTDKDGNKYFAGIVESGSNANGSYIKFSDGTMICRGNFTIPQNTDVYYLVFPVPFFNTDYAISLTNIFYNSCNILYSIGVNEKAKIAIYARSISANIATPDFVTKGEYIAIGKWK